MALSSNPDDRDARLSDLEFSDLKPSDDANWLSRLETLESLAQIVREEKLGELDVRLGSARLKLKARGSGRAARVGSSSAAPDDRSDAAQSHEEAIVATPIGDAPAIDANLISVVSPMVGLFYRAPSPADPVFVSVGDHVEVGQTLGLIETMKVFNEITSEVEGTVASIAFENGQLIETGDAIMAIRRA